MSATHPSRSTTPPHATHIWTQMSDLDTTGACHKNERTNESRLQGKRALTDCYEGACRIAKRLPPTEARCTQSRNEERTGRGEERGGRGGGGQTGRHCTFHAILSLNTIFKTGLASCAVARTLSNPDRENAHV